MPVKISPVVDSLETVPESLRGNYEEREGRFYLSGEIEIETPETITGLKSALDNERDQAKKRGERLKLFEGIDPEAARAALEAQRTAEHDKAMSKGDFEKLRNQMVEDHTRKMEAATARITKREDQIKKVLRTNAATAAIAANRGKVKALLPHVLDALHPVEDEETGEWDVQVMEKGKVKHNTRGEPMTPEEFVASLRDIDDFKALFDGTGMSGSNASGSGERKRNGKVVISRADAQNVATFRRLNKEAADAGKSFNEYVEIVG